MTDASFREGYPTPDTRYPIPLADGSKQRGAVFLKAVIKHPRAEVGDYTYASSFDPPEDWLKRLAPYFSKFSLERLIIGKFCQIADGVQFITASANHKYDGISSYPFAAFGGGPLLGRPSLPAPGPDTIIGNDVWIGQDAKILPGARIGDGVIVGAGAVVSGTMPPYHIIGGNPARPIRARFSPDDVERLLQIAWWNWPIEKILRHEAEICGADVEALSRAADIPLSGQV